MAAEETAILNRIRLAAHLYGVVLLKNVRGNFRTMDGKRVVAAGLSAKGSSDLIGWRTVTITPDMVGTQIAQLVAIEVKTATGRCTKEQEDFLNNVRKSGGIGAVMRTEAEWEQIIC